MSVVAVPMNPAVRITTEQRPVLVRFAAGYEAERIAQDLNLDQTAVDTLIGRVARGDTDRARVLVQEYDQRATLVSAATGRPAASREAPPGSAPRVQAAGPPAVAVPARLGLSVAMPPAGGVERMLAEAEASDRQRTRALGGRVRQLLTELQTRLAGEAAEREAQVQVDRLRAELAAAEAALRQTRRPDPAATSAGSPAGDHVVVNRAVREWAAAHGVACNARGHVRRDVLEQWRAATGGAVGSPGAVA